MSDVGRWLEGLGLGRYAEAFAAHDIDLDILAELSEPDLERLGRLARRPQASAARDRGARRRRAGRRRSAAARSAAAAGRARAAARATRPSAAS